LPGVVACKDICCNESDDLGSYGPETVGVITSNAIPDVAILLKPDKKGNC
jgi:hypothetical protein